MASLVTDRLTELVTDDAVSKPSLEGNDRLCDKLRGLRAAIAEDPAVRTLGLREQVSRALCTLAIEPLSPPLRRQLGLCMIALGDAEPRAVLPLVDSLFSSLSEPKKGADSKGKALPTGQATVLSCLTDVWRKHGRHCASRVEEMVSIAKALWRPASPPDVRLAAVRAAQTALEASPVRGVSLSTHVALVKPLMIEPLTCLRYAGIRLAAAMVRADKTLAADILAAIVKGLDGPDPLNASAGLGELMAVLASGGSHKLEKTSSLKSFRRKGNTVGGTEGIHNYISAIFCKDKCGEHLRVNLSRTYSSFLREMKRFKSEHDIVVEFVPRVLNLAVATTKHAWREDARVKQACVSYILRTGIGLELTEAGQELLFNTLVADINERKNAPNMHIALSCALQELTSTLVDLGGNLHPTDEMRELILSQLHSVHFPLRLSAGTCLRSFAVSSPDQLTAVIRQCVASIHKQTDLAESSPQTLHGVSLCIASAMMAAPAGTLGLPVELLDQCISLANMMVKAAWAAKGGGGWGGKGVVAEEDAINVKSARMNAGWAIVCAAMRMGPEWVEGYMPLLMQMWADALINPPVDSSGSSPKMTESDLQCWIEATCGALTSLQVLATDCPTLLAREDIAHVVNTCVAKACTSDLVVKGPKSFPTTDGSSADGTRNLVRTDLVKLRLFRLLSSLPASHLSPALHANILKRTFQVFGRSVDRRGIATSCFSEYLNPQDDILQPSEMCADEHDTALDAAREARAKASDPIAQQMEECAVDTWSAGVRDVLLPARHLRVQMVDQCVRLFVRVFPLAEAREQASLLAAVVEKILSIEDKLQRSSAMANVCTALLGALKLMAESRAAVPASSEWLGRMDEILHRALADSSVFLRRVAAEALGLLARMAPDSYLQGLMVVLTSPAVKPVGGKGARDADADRNDARAAHAFAIGCVYRYAGGLRCNQIVDLSAGVQKLLEWSTMGGMIGAWGIHGLCLTLEYSSAPNDRHVRQALTLVQNVFHHSQPVYAHDAEYPALMVSLGQVCSTVLSSIGMELRDNGKELATVLSVLNELNESHYGGEKGTHAALAAIGLVQRVLLFLNRSAVPATLFAGVQPHLSARSGVVRLRAIRCIHQMAEQDIAVCAALRGIEKQLFCIADSDSECNVRDEACTLLALMAERSASNRVMEWFTMCKDVCVGRHVRSLFSSAHDSTAGINDAAAQRPTTNDETQGGKEGPGGGEGSEGEEEGEEGEGGGDGKKAAQVGQDVVGMPAGERSVYVPRWQTKRLALECFMRLLVGLDGSPQHFSLVMARESAEGERACIVYHLSSLVAMAYTAVTSRPVPLRLIGVQLLEDIIRRFAAAADPEVEGGKLLEQSQAQITSVLRTALRRDEHPSVAVAACNVCWEFIVAEVSPEDEYASQRVVGMLLDKVEENVSQRKGCYSDLAYASVQMTALRTLGRLYVERLWVAGVKEHVRVSLGITGQVNLTDEEETLSAGVFSPRMSPLLTTCAPLFTRAASEVIRITSSPIVNGASELSGGKSQGEGGKKKGGGKGSGEERSGSSVAVGGGGLPGGRSGEDAACDLFNEVLPLILYRLSDAASAEGELVKDACTAVASLCACLTRSTARCLSSSTSALVLDYAAMLISNTQHLTVVDSGLDLAVHVTRLHNALQDERMAAHAIYIALAPVNALFLSNVPPHKASLEPHAQRADSYSTTAATHSLSALAKALPGFLAETPWCRSAIAALTFAAISCCVRLSECKELVDAAVACLVAVDDAVGTFEGDTSLALWCGQLGRSLGESLLQCGPAVDVDLLLLCLSMYAPKHKSVSVRKETHNIDNDKGDSKSDAIDENKKADSSKQSNSGEEKGDTDADKEHTIDRAEKDTKVDEKDKKTDEKDKGDQKDSKAKADECTGMHAWSRHEPFETLCINQLITRVDAGGQTSTDTLRAVRTCVQGGIGGKLPEGSPRLALLHSLLIRIAPHAAKALAIVEGREGDAKVQCEAVRVLLLCHAAVPAEHRGDLLSVVLPLLIGVMSGGEASAAQLAAAGCAAIAQSNTVVFRERVAVLSAEDKVALQQGMLKAMQGSK